MSQSALTLMEPISISPKQANRQTDKNKIRNDPTRKEWTSQFGKNKNSQFPHHNSSRSTLASSDDDRDALLTLRRVVKWPRCPKLSASANCTRFTTDDDDDDEDEDDEDDEEDDDDDDAKEEEEEDEEGKEGPSSTAANAANASAENSIGANCVRCNSSAMASPSDSTLELKSAPSMLVEVDEEW